MGGGTDYPRYYEKHGGEVLSTTINKYCYINLRKMPPFLGSKYRVFWSKMETVDTVEEIQHSGVRGCLQYLKIDDGIEVNHAGDLPARSGLGSSSAFTVGMLHALRLMEDKPVFKQEIAKEAIEVEQDVLKETVGIQDQIACSFGGLNHIRIAKNGTFALDRIYLATEARESLEKHFVLVFTNLQRYASEIAADQVDNVDRKQKELERIMALVPQAVGALNTPRDFGELLHESWMLKRELSEKVSNPKLDELYDTARSNGAIGGKVLGAGGGGFMLFCIPPESRKKVIDALGLLSIPFQFEERGTQAVLK